MNIAILGTGFISKFYARALAGQRRKDKVVSVYGRNEVKAKQFAEEFQIPHFSTNMQQVVGSKDVDAVVVGLPNDVHLEAVLACTKAGKHVLMTKPLGRNASEALQMLEAVEKAGVTGGYLEDLCYTPKFLKSLESVQNGMVGEVIWAKSREAHPGPHSSWFWSKERAGGGAIIDLGCHCIEISRNFIGKDIKPVEVMCWADTRFHPIDAEDNAIGLVKYANGAIGQFEVSWSFRGGMDLRDEVMGSEGTIWVNNFLRTGMDLFTSGKSGTYTAEKAESDTGWLFPMGDEVHDLGYNTMFTDMFDAIEQHREPAETFYDGYIVNAIMDAAYVSAASRQWEPVQLPIWRGNTEVKTDKQYASFDNDHYLIKEEVLPSGEKTTILKHKQTGSIVVR